jgi:MATE family multidrug resistance protein
VGYFNGIGRTQLTLLLFATQALENALFNQLFIFKLKWGVAGSGWATTIAQAVGLAPALLIFLSADNRRKFKSHLTWKPHLGRLWWQWRLALVMSLVPVGNMVALFLFQAMQVRAGVISGAATQVVMVLIAIGDIPALGIASAGATLVGHSLGAGDQYWAKRVGTRVILLSALFTSLVGAFLALAGPSILPSFVGKQEADTAAIVALSGQLLRFAPVYLFFEGLNFSSAACLRYARDTAVPATLVVVLSWTVLLPLAHSLTFPRQGGWLDLFPQLGWGATGGWTAMLIYVTLLWSTLSLRWLYGPCVGHAFKPVSGHGAAHIR